MIIITIMIIKIGLVILLKVTLNRPCHVHFTYCLFSHLFCASLPYIFRILIFNLIIYKLIEIIESIYYCNYDSPIILTSLPLFFFSFSILSFFSLSIFIFLPVFEFISGSFPEIITLNKTTFLHQLCNKCINYQSLHEKEE